MADPFHPDSNLPAPLPDSWTNFLAATHNAIEEAIKLAAGRETGAYETEAARRVFGRFMTNGSGFYVPLQERHGGATIVVSDFACAFQKTGLPLSILFHLPIEPPPTLFRKNPKYTWRRGEKFPEYMPFFVRRLNQGLGLRARDAGILLSCVFDKSAVIAEIAVNCHWRVSLPVKNLVQSGKVEDPKREQVLEYLDISPIVSELQQSYCFPLSELLEQRMRPKTFDLKSSVKSLLESSNIPRDRWHDELKRLIEELTPETKPLPLPEKAPELFADRPDRRENIEEFLRRVWKPWIDGGTLTRPAFGRLDPQGEMALRNRLRNNALPPDLHLPTIKEVNDRALAELPPDVVRLASAAKRRRYGPENT